MVFDSYAALRAHRSFLLPLAVADVKKWCAPAEKMIVGRKPSDQHWLRRFSVNAGTVNGEDARTFLITFMLIRAGWNVEAVATEIRSFATLALSDPTIDIPAFAVRLQALNKLKRRQTSAASKIATFAHPTSEVYIWDALATKSARLRDRERTSKVAPKVKLGIYCNGKDHNYPVYHAACVRARKDEQNQFDFRESVRALIDHFTTQGSEMSDRSRVPEHFIERRLLDKLMFWEGWTVDRGHLPPTNPQHAIRYGT